ncbi:membrane protein [Pseudonocardia sp. EC080610-09]|uniref:ABC transporter permease subunit n=1 Tax=unclassified Pseudonocardia TaxID=2619320 RepID=UPI0006CB3CF4|nr:MULTISPECIES: ABC transporter permease subunit [unclassified Pseudonocardia]ALE73255.1 membrane protein [Pseudonocardia sp. EC080625-04]ALL76597.1 membrane protein [Pseudonocardia sp. EC080610-09]ALL83623.1 membrane protein [Pseudonocardia sp. EC080619-01]
MTVTADARPVSWRRLLGAELRWVLRRPRTWIMFLLLAAVPVLMGLGIVLADGPRRGLVGEVVGNGLTLPVAALSLLLALLLPLVVAVAAADAIAGEGQHGTLRGLLLAPVGRLRLVAMKAFGVLVVAAVAVTLVTVTGLVAGWAMIGPPVVLAGTGDGGALLTLSGSVLTLPDALFRVGVAAGWTLVQLAAVGAVALAVSSFTEHPLVVLSSVLGGLILFGVLGAIPALEPLRPWLITTGWGAATDVLRDPLPWSQLGRSSLVAVGYLAAGAATLVVRMLRRDA